MVACEFCHLLLPLLFVVVTGALWYSPLLFGNVWARIIGKEKLKAVKFAPALIKTVVAHGVFVVTYAILKNSLPVATWQDAAFYGLLLGIIVSSMQVGHASFTGRPLGVFIIDSGHDITCIVGAAIIMNCFQSHHSGVKM